MHPYEVILLIIGILAAIAFAVTFWMVKTAADECPESDPDRDAGRSESAIAADAAFDRAAAAVISGNRELAERKPVALASAEYFLTVRRVCMDCAIVLQEGTGPTTHGLCPQCAEVRVAEMERLWPGCTANTAATATRTHAHAAS